MKKLTVVAASIVAVLTPVHAQTERDLDSHEHGAANMNIAIEGTSIYVELESPWNNLVGFEHAPSTEEQHKLVDDAIALLQDPTKLFSFENAECKVASVNLDSSLDGGDEHHDHEEEHAHGKHDHDEEHAHGKEDHDEEHAHGKEDHDEDHAHGKEEHDDHDEDHAHGEDTHSEVFVAIEMNCNSLDNLSVINVEFLDIWSGFEDLDVQMIGPNGQALIELGQGNTKIDVTSVL